MIPLNEHMLTLPAAARALPSRPHISTIWRWAKRGVRGVRLETIAIAGKRYTSREALERFVEATTAAADGNQSANQSNRRSDDEVERQLDELGLGGD